MRSGVNTMIAPRSRSGATPSRWASSSESSASLLREGARRKRITEGQTPSPEGASGVPKSVSSETSALPSRAAR